MIKLHKPLAFFDLETTGITVGADRIVEISILKLMPDGSKSVLTKRVNPEIPIPEGASKYGFSFSPLRCFCHEAGISGIILIFIKS